MSRELIILIAEAIAVYLLVLGTHALRRRFGLAHFYALLGGLTAIMSWVTDAGVAVHVGGVTFMVGSTVFYTSLLLGVFVIYVFDGPHATRIAISTIAGVSVLVPVIAVVLHFQMQLTGEAGLGYVPVPSLRINAASVVATVMDLLFLAFVWEFLGKPKPPMSIGLRAFITLLGVLWLDVLLFGVGAFLGTSGFFAIVKGTFLSRLVIATFAWPFLYAYLAWQSRRTDAAIENRPVLAILKEVAEVRGELTLAHREVERRKQAEEKTRTLLEAIPVPVFYKDCEGRYQGCNRAFEDIVGRQRTDIIGKTVYDMSPRDLADKYWAKDQELFAGASPGWQRYESQLKTPEGDVREVVFSKASFTDAGGNVVGLIGVILDVTERRRAEAELRQAQKLTSIGTLARGVAHGINNPIMGIMNYAQLILDKLGPDSPVAEFATEIGNESGRVASVVSSLLKFAEQSKEDSSPARVSDIVEATLPLVRNAFLSDQITIDVRVPESLPRIECRSRQIQQVLVNLLTNARDALNEKHTGVAPEKKIIISAEERGWGNGQGSLGADAPSGVIGQESLGPYGPSMVNGHSSLEKKGSPMSSDPSPMTNDARSANDQLPVTNDVPKAQMTNAAEHSEAHDVPAGRWIRLTVADNGTGMSAETVDRIFDPFFTTKDRTQFAGLGLSTSLGIVRQHGGMLSVESAVGSGMRFHVDLPVE